MKYAVITRRNGRIASCAFGLSFPAAWQLQAELVTHLKQLLLTATIGGDAGLPRVCYTIEPDPRA